MELDPEWLTGIGTLTLAAVAAFQDKIRAWLLRPKLSVTVACQPPDCHKTQMIASGAKVLSDCYYFRIRVKNSGNQRAELVEVYAAELLKQQADGTFRKQEPFLPMNLLWSHIGAPFLEAISPSMEKHCDLGHIIKPVNRRFFPFEEDQSLGTDTDKTIFSVDLQVRPFTMTHLLPPGTYRLRLVIGAANAKPVPTMVEIHHTGDWFDDEAKMLSDGVGVRML